MSKAYWKFDKKYAADHKEALRAIAAVWNGTANEGQQRKAMSFILEEICARAKNQYYPSERDTTFALGKKFVGDRIVDAITVSKGTIQEK